MKIVALITAYNEELYIEQALRHCAQQGISVYLINNNSTDRTETIAKAFLGKGLIGMETLPRPNGFDLPTILQRETELAATLDGDWFIHLDADEFLVSNHSQLTLCDAFEDADRRGFNAIHFMEYVFVPTAEHPHHEHPSFLETMRWYYPFLPRVPHRLIAWKKQPHAVDLLSSGGHVVAFEGMRIYPRWLAIKHYMFLSLDHALRKWGQMTFSPDMIRRGWGARRRQVNKDTLVLPPENELRVFSGDWALNPSFPERTHKVFRPSGMPEVAS